MSKLYCYFNSNGALTESIADGAVRRGDAGIDKIYMYWDRAEPFDRLTSQYWNNGEWSIEEQIIYNIENVAIEPIKNQDLKCFEYGKKYPFIVITLPQFVNAGSTGLTITAYLSETEVKALGTIFFNVENTVAKLSPDISQSQYDYLVWLTTGIDNKVPYSGATRDVDLGENTLKVDKLGKDSFEYELPDKSGTIDLDSNVTITTDYGTLSQEELLKLRNNNPTVEYVIPNKRIVHSFASIAFSSLSEEVYRFQNCEMASVGGTKLQFKLCGVSVNMVTGTFSRYESTYYSYLDSYIDNNINITDINNLIAYAKAQGWIS